MVARPPKVGFVFVDVTTGATALRKRLLKGEKVVMQITVELDNDPRGMSDDGVSIQFTSQCRKMRELKK